MTPARRSAWPWIVIGTLALVVVVFLASLLLRMLNPPVSPLANENDARSVIQVDVVNASGRNGAGRTLMKFLRNRGFDVVEISTSANPTTASYVVDRMGDKLSALKVAAAIGIADSLVQTEIDSMLFVRATVVLGTDVEALEPFSK